MDANFETGFSLVERLFAYEMDSFQFIATLAGGTFIVVGLIITAIIGHYRINGQNVLLEVIGLHEEARRIDKNDDSGRVAEKLANPAIRVEYRVQNGPQVGLEALSSTASSSTEHQLGDVVQGYLFPNSKDVMSRAQSVTGIKFGLFTAAFGAGFILLVNFMGAQW